MFSENSFAVVIVFGRPCQCALNHVCPSSTLTSSSRRPASLTLCDKRRGNLIIFSVHQIDSLSRRVLFLLVLQVLLGRNKRGSLTGGGSICQWQPIRDPPSGRSSSGNTVNFLVTPFARLFLASTTCCTHFCFILVIPVTDVRCRCRNVLLYVLSPTCRSLDFL